MTFQTQDTEGKNDQWGENEWGAEDDGMGFGTDINPEESETSDTESSETEGMGSDVEAVEEEERDL